MNNNIFLQNVHNTEQFYTLGEAIYAFGRHNILYLAGNIFIFYEKNIPNKTFQNTLFKE